MYCVREVGSGSGSRSRCRSRLVAYMRSRVDAWSFGFGFGGLNFNPTNQPTFSWTELKADVAKQCRYEGSHIHCFSGEQSGTARAESCLCDFFSCHFRSYFQNYEETIKIDLINAREFLLNEAKQPDLVKDSRGKGVIHFSAGAELEKNK